METDTIWILLFIGYAIGLIPIAILGIMGTNDAIDFQNRMARAEREIFPNSGMERQRSELWKSWQS